MASRKKAATAVQTPASTPETASNAEYISAVTNALFSVLDDLAIEEDTIGRVVRKMKRMKRDKAPEAEQKALFDPLAEAILKSINAEPAGKCEKSGLLLMPSIE